MLAQNGSSLRPAAAAGGSANGVGAKTIHASSWRLSLTGVPPALPVVPRLALVHRVTVMGDEVRADVVGTVLRLQRYPLKGADGERLQAVDVAESGLADDRRWSLARSDGSAVTAKELPALRTVQARSVDGRLHVEPPLAQVVDADVQVLDAPGRNQNVAAVHLASEGAAAAADAPAGCDPEPRANLVLTLAEPGRERSWVGRRLRLGDVELRVTRTPAHCLGVYAEVVTPGTVRQGDAVHLL